MMGQKATRFTTAIAMALLLTMGHLGALELSQLFCDHMVMQRNMAVPVWGWASPGETIVVSFDGQVKEAVAGNDGKWMVRLDAMEADDPLTMTVRGEAKIMEIHDILLGEVWVCSGQSNMDWALVAARNGKEEAATADHPNIRLFGIGNGVTPKGPVERVEPYPQPDARPCQWRICNPKSAAMFSAVGYFFGRDLHQSLNVPVGLIVNAEGATPAEAWTSREALLADPDLKFIVRRWENMEAYAKTTPGKMELDAVLADYDAKQKSALANGGWVWRSDAYRSPDKRLGYPATFFNGRVNPLIPYAIRGVIWYQGEGNVDMGYAYRKLFPALITDWRKRWGQGDFPFLFVQLANWSGMIPENPTPSDWAELRESQLKALALPNTAMVVTVDLGEAHDIHPKNKQDVGLRLAMAARAVAYQENLVHSGPIYRRQRIEGGSIRVFFDSTGSGLMAKGGELRHFAIAGSDRRFVWANAEIDGDTVIVRSDEVPEPVAVRYAWAVNPDGCNLYNRESLPASPFRTDDWPGVTTDKNYASLYDRPVSFKRKK